MIISFITSFSECFKNKVFKSFSKSFFLSLEIDFKTKVIILMAESNECLLLPLKLILGSNAIPFGEDDKALTSEPLDFIVLEKKLS